MFFLGLMIIPCLFVYGQERLKGFGGLEWYKVLAGNEPYDQVKDMELGSDGSIYYSGLYNSSLFVGVPFHEDTLYQDSLPLDPQRAHGYVVKVDSLGQFQWAWIIRGDEGSSSAVNDIMLDANGGLWVTGQSGGNITIPMGSNLNLEVTDGFLLHLNAAGAGSNYVHIGGAGVWPRKVFLDEQGQLQLMIQSFYYPVSIDNDTIPLDTNSDPFMVVALLDTAMQVIQHYYVGTLDASRGTYLQSTKDSHGNVYIVLDVYNNPVTSPALIVLGEDTISALGNPVVKVDPQGKVTWIREISKIISNGVIEMQTTEEEDLYIAADHYQFNSSISSVAQFNRKGFRDWELTSGGFLTATGDMKVAGDFIYWSGYFQCDMVIDTIHFTIGDRQPWPSGARTGYLAVVNRHTGKLAWLMSDATTNQDKRFGRMVANDDQNITVETRVNTTLCTVDTLTLQVSSIDVPYNMLLRFSGKTFPVWPKLDSIPENGADFMIYPNPTTGSFSVEVNDAWGSETIMEIYDILGRQLMQGLLRETSMPLDYSLICSQALLIRLVDQDTKRAITHHLILQR